MIFHGISSIHVNKNLVLISLTREKNFSWYISIRNIRTQSQHDFQCFCQKSTENTLGLPQFCERKTREILLSAQNLFIFLIDMYQENFLYALKKSSPNSHWHVSIKFHENHIQTPPWRKKAYNLFIFFYWDVSWSSMRNYVKILYEEKTTD